MTRTVEIDQTADQAAVGAVSAPVLSGAAGGSRVKVPARGQYNWAMSTIAKAAGAGPNLVVELRGTNNPDEADITGEVLITLTHGGNGVLHGSAANKAYKYVFIYISARTNLDLDRVIVVGSGFAGLA